MSNTSLKPIKIPALGHANFGKAIMEQFANIDANFQKLSNFELNAGIPGKSCLYVTINLAAPFVYPTSDVNNPDKSQEDYNAWLIWASHDKAFERELRGTWTQLKDSVAADYEQFRKLTGLREFEYAMIAAKMLWGYTQTFTGSSVDPTSESLTGSLHTKYGAVEGPVECEDSNGTKTTYYGNWLREMFMMGKADYDVIKARAELFKKHVQISVPGRIVVAISPSDEEVAYYPVGSLEYWYIDPRFRNSAVNREDTSVYDMSCVMHWTPEGKIDDISWPGHFEILEIFPTIRRGEDGKYYWFINGLNTGVPVQGPAGKDGNPSRLVVVQRVENVLGYHPEDYPNGKLAVGPLVGDWTVPMSAFAGDSPRNLPSRTQYVNDMPTIVPQWVAPNGEWPGWPENLIPAESNAYSRTTSFKLHIDAGLAWLNNNQDGFVLNEPENYFRIYRIVGREIFWTGPGISDEAAKKDPVNHLYDPSCDECYFGENHVSMPSDSASIQQLIEQLDGATAIVLPGPAYQYDRTDSTYWITTLRKVEWRDPNADISSRSGRYMLMAYCSDEERVHNSLDEHTQAGMMQRLDAYAYKKNGDNRNKPRGLMLPIGSAYAAYTDGDFDWAWASHVVHSDCGGFTSITNDLRGVQQVTTPAKKLTVATDAMYNATGQAATASEAQYTEIIGKRILHIGSVNDYRALNYVDNNTEKGWNGGVPGREELPQNLKGKIGNADFYGKTGIDGWFIGSELHVDEPMTITRYRDLHKRQRLLNVEGDVVIGPRVHANGPNFRYRNRDGGLVVHSTISPDTGRDKDIFPKNYDITSSIFNESWYNGLELIHRGFHRELLDAGKQNWQYRFNRWMYGGGRYRAFYDVDGRTISTAGPIVRSTDRHMFSILGDDGIGARVMVAQDGFVVYNPNGLTVADGRPLTAFSVDAMGNIQTTGSEVRSNADDTLWVFHSRWTGPQNSYADLQKSGETINWDWLNTDKGSIKDMVFTMPGHNQLMFGTDHEVQFVDSKHDSLRRLARSWRATNFYPWKDSENTELGLVPMGWIFNFGPLDSTGYHMRTFMQKRNEEFGQTWGSNELMPVTVVLSPDVNHYHGVHHVMGIDCMAVRSKAKEIDHAQNNYISGRYGSQIAHGLIVGPARTNIGGQFNGQQNQEFPRNFDIQDFVTEELCMRYKSTSWWENSTDANSATLGMGEKASPMLLGETINTPIAIWGRGSIFAEKSLIADEDLVVNRAATIRAQARAKSFRRHHNSSTGGDPFENGYCGWSFLLDNGMSSCNAPRHTIEEGGNVWPASQKTPLVLDIGKGYGNKRLVKFGYAKQVQLSNTNEVKVTLVNKDETPDREMCLFGKFPGGGVSQAVAKYSNFWVGSTVGTKAVKYPPIFNDMVFGRNPTVVIAQWNHDWVNVRIYILCNAWFDWGGGACSLGVDSHGNGNHNSSWVAQKTYAKLPKGCPKPTNSIDKYWGAMYTDCKYIWDDGKGHGEQGGKGYQEKGTKIKGADRAHPGIVIRLQGAEGLTQFYGYDGNETAQPGDFIIQQAALSGMLFPPNRAHRYGNFDAPVVCLEFSYANPDSVSILDTEVGGGAGVEPLPNPGDDDYPGDTGADEVDECWLWDSTAAPTSSTLKTWLEKKDRSVLLSAIEDAAGDFEDGSDEVGDLTSVTDNYGYATIKKTGVAECEISMIVTAYKSGASDLSHRSINFKYKKRLMGLTVDIDLIGTYIIGDSDDSVAGDELMTQVFGGTYNNSTGYIVQSNGSVSHTSHPGAMDANCKAVLEGTFNQAASRGADIRNIGGRTVASWMTFHFSNCSMKLGYQTSNIVLGIMEFYSSPNIGNDGAAFRKETGKVKLTGTFQAGQPITVTGISMSDVKTENFA